MKVRFELMEMGPMKLFCSATPAAVYTQTASCRQGRPPHNNPFIELPSIHPSIHPCMATEPFTPTYFRSLPFIRTANGTGKRRE